MCRVSLDPGQGRHGLGGFRDLHRRGSPSGIIAAMWNHGARMEGQAQKQGIALPILTGQELADITAYLGSLTPTRPPQKKAK